MLPGMSGIIGGTVGGAEIFVSYASATFIVTTSLTINKPTGTTSGDVLLAVMTGTDGITFTGGAGWTEIYDSGATPAFRLARLTAGGSEPASYTFTTSSTGSGVGQIICLRGVQFDVAGAAMTTLTGDGNLAIGGITLVGGLLIAAVATNQTATDIAHSTPSGMVKIANTTIPFALQPAITTFFQSMPSGATGTRTSAITNGTVENAGILIGFKP